MERSEPSLVPEWLRSAGSVAGSGSSAQHFSSPSTHADTPSVAHHSRNRSSKTNDFDSPHSMFLERTSSTNSRRSSINGSAKHVYSSFNRSHRDKDCDREKDRASFGDPWDKDSSDPLASLLSGRIERDALRRSHSLVSRKQSDTVPRRVVVDTKSGGSRNHNNGNGMHSGATMGSTIQKAVFDKDFPSLGTEEKQGIAEMGRVSSPGLGVTASQCLPVGSSALMIGGEGFKSALADVPTLIGSSSGPVATHQTVTSTSGSIASGTTAGLNMAEALTQTPARARSAPQVLVKTHRLEERAIKQSRQLIPVTPTTPKTLLPNSSEKSKPKTSIRNSEMNVAAKSLPQLPSSLHIASQSVCSVNAKFEGPKSSGKFTDLKSVVWENGFSPTSKEVPNSTNLSNSKAGNQHVVASAAATPTKNPNNLKSPTEQKPASLDLKIGSALEKKHSLSQVKSRNDFFNLIKKKTLMNSSTVLPDSGPIVSSPSLEKSVQVNREVTSPYVLPQSLGNGTEGTSNGNTHAHEDVCGSPDNEVRDPISSATIYPDEEEAAFLRSLGWEENSDEDEGLTEEEINAFYQECKKLGPTTFKLCQGMQPNLSKLFDSYATNLRASSAELSSSNHGSEA